MRDAEYWQRKYERAERGRLEALDRVRRVGLNVINTAADEMQQQIDALEQQVLRRAALVKIETEGRALRLTFVRRGEIHQVDLYNGWGNARVEELRKTLLED